MNRNNLSCDTAQCAAQVLQWYRKMVIGRDVIFGASRDFRSKFVLIGQY